MRTTVTLEKDVIQMLQEEMRRSRRSFKETLNATLHLGFYVKAGSATAAKFEVDARALDLRAGINPVGLNKLTDDLEVGAFLLKTRRTQARLIGAAQQSGAKRGRALG
jgi:hypothetical protein